MCRCDFLPKAPLFLFLDAARAGALARVEAPRAGAMALRSSTAQHPFRAAPRFQRRAAARCGKKGAKKRPPAEAKAGPSVRPPEAGSTLDVVKPYELEPAYKPSVRAAED